MKNRLPTAAVCDAITPLWLNFLRISVTLNTFGLRVGSANFHACINVTNGFITFLFVEIKRIIVDHLIDNIACAVLDSCDGPCLCKRT